MSCKSDLLASVIAGITSELSVVPICTVQTVYQTQRDLHKSSSRHTIPRVIRDLYRQHGGYRAFFNASASAILSQMASTGSKFTLYELVKNWRDTQKSDLANNMINGALAGTLAVFITQPFDVLKNYHQRQLSIIPDIKRNPLILYRGMNQSFAKSILLISTLYPVNDFFRSRMTKYNDSPVALAAFATTIAISPIIHPIDLLKRRAMAGEKLWMGWNPVNYYRGLFINWCRAMPHFVVTMVTIDLIKNKLQ